MSGFQFFGNDPSQADPSSRIDQALKGIQALLFPVDGILNGSKITFDHSGNELCTISVRDAIAIKEAVKLGLRIGVLSSRNAEGYRPMLEALGVQDLYLNGEHVFYSYDAFRHRHSLSNEECAYIGDDIGDIDVLAKVGLPATSIDGADYLRNRVAYISGFEGGKGCIRELVEEILTRQGKWPYIERPDEEDAVEE